MPTEVIVVFMLFVAVLAFAWFYLQRAKARDVMTVDGAPTPNGATAAADRTDTPVA